MQSLGFLEHSDSSEIRILLVGEQILSLAALRALLATQDRLSVVGSASWTDALNMAHTQPQVILLDILPGREGHLDLLVEFIAVFSQTRLLILTDVHDPDMHLRAVRL